MNCDDVIRLLPDMLYDELDDASRQRIEAHLTQCQSCREEAQSFERTVRVLDQWSGAEAPADSEELTKLLERTVRPRTRWWGRHPVLTGLAAGIVLFIGLWLVSTEVSFDQGRLTISMGRSDADSVRVQDVNEGPDETQLYQLVNDRVELSTSLAGEAMADYLHDWTRAHEERQLAILSLIGQMREQDLVALDLRLRLLERERLSAREAAAYQPQNLPYGAGPGWAPGRVTLGNAVYQTVYNEETGQFELQHLTNLENPEDYQ